MLIRINTDALEAMREFQAARGRALTGENEIGHDEFEIDISPKTLARMEQNRRPGESLSEAIVRLSIAARGQLPPL